MAVDQPEDILVAYLFDYGDVEEVIPLCIKNDSPIWGFGMWLQKEGFQRIPDTLIFRCQQILAAVEVKWPHCYVCGQLGHLAWLYPPTPRKGDGTPSYNTSTSNTNTDHT